MTKTLVGVGIAATVSLGVWLYLRRSPAGATSISQIVDGISVPEVTIADREFDYSNIAMPSVEFENEVSVMEKIGQVARSVAATVSNWFHPRGEKYKPLFDAAEKKYGIPSGLLFRQAYQESRFREDIITGKVRSSAGAVGIMQIVPKHHPKLGEAGALDVPRAIDYAGSILANWKKQFGSWELALAAYNAGPGNVTKYKGIPPFEETRNYVSQITADVNVRNA